VPPQLPGLGLDQPGGGDAQTVAKNRALADKHLIPFVGKAKLKDLSADAVDDWLTSRVEALSTRSLRDVLAILRRSIEHAQRRDKAVRNVALLVTVPEGRAGRPSKALNLEQAKAVLGAARGSRLYAYLVLSLLGGVRTEEAQPLTWDHVYLTLEDGIPPHVAVWRSVRRHGETKTRKSRPDDRPSEAGRGRAGRTPAVAEAGTRLSRH